MLSLPTWKTAKAVAPAALVQGVPALVSNEKKDQIVLKMQSVWDYMEEHRDEVDTIVIMMNKGAFKADASAPTDKIPEGVSVPGAVSMKSVLQYLSPCVLGPCTHLAASPGRMQNCARIGSLNVQVALSQHHGC